MSKEQKKQAQHAVSARLSPGGATQTFEYHLAKKEEEKLINKIGIKLDEYDSSKK